MNIAAESLVLKTVFVGIRRNFGGNMNRILAFLVIFSMTIPAIAIPVSEVAVQVQDRGSSGIELSFQLPSISAAAFSLSEAEGIFETIDGREVPAVTRWVAVPIGHRVDLEIRSRRGNVRDGLGNVLTSHIDGDFAELDPPQVATVGRIAMFRGVAITPVTFYPLQYEVDGDRRVENSSVEIAVNFVPDSDAPAAMRVNNLPGSSARRLLNNFLVNSPYRDDPRRDPVQQTNHDRILIVHNNSDLFMERGRPWVDSLANWKRQMGYHVDVVSFPFNVDPREVYHFIRENYFEDNQDNDVAEFGSLSHLIIIGNYEGNLGFPRYFAGDELEGDHFYSLMYANIADEDNWYIPQITVGRMYATSFEELAGVIKRSILFEREPFREEGDDWFTRAIYTGERVAAPGGDYVPSMVHLGRWVYSRLVQRGYTDVDTLYAPTEREEQAMIDSVRRLLHFDHGLSLAVSRGWLKGCVIDEQRVVDTGRKNPFVMAITCLSGETQEQFFRSTTANRPKGPIVSMAILQLTHTRTNNSLVGGMVRAIRYSNIHQPGWIQVLGKIQMADDYRYDDAELERIKGTLACFTLMGDPSVNVYAAVPVELNAYHPETLAPGETGLSIRVEAEGQSVTEAVVTVWQEDGVHLVASPNEAGWVRFTFEDGLEEGSLGMTVMRYDAFPYLATIDVRDEEVMIDLLGVEFDDEDGLFGNGESVPTTLTLFNNSGDQDIEGVHVTLSSDDPLVSFDPEEIDVGDMDADSEEEVTFNTIFDRSSRAERDVRVNIDVEAGELNWEHSFLVETSGHLLAVQRTELGNNQIFGPGELVSLFIFAQNTGDLSTPRMRANLVSLHPAVDVLAGAVQYNVLQPGQTRSQDAGLLRLRLDQYAIPGNIAQLRLDVSALDQDDTFRDTVFFEMEIEAEGINHPTGPDEYGYVCFDVEDRIGGWEKSPVYQWREINPEKPEADFQGTPLYIGDGGNEEDSSVVVIFPEDFHFTYYGQEFDTMIVCSNGWIAFGAEQSMYVDSRNWQIPGVQGPDAQVCVQWQDFINPQPRDRGLFVHYIEEEGVFIVEWSEMEIWGGPADLAEFQVILYDTERWYPDTPDSEIKMQYKTFVAHAGHAEVDNQYSTIGVKNLDGSDGLEYAYWNRYSRFAHGIDPSGSALLFTTDVRPIIGAVRGRVVDASDPDSPIQGASVEASPVGLTAVTDNNGEYLIEDIPIGEIVVYVMSFGFNTGNSHVVILEGETSEQDFALTHPEIGVAPRSISETLLQNVTAQASFNVQNNGNGPLEFTLSTRYIDGSESEFDERLSVNVSAMVEDKVIYGCQFVGDRVYVTGANVDRMGVRDTTRINKIYVYNRNRELVETIIQPSHTLKGFFGLAYDGEFLYGGEDDRTITVFNTEGNFPRVINIPVEEQQIEIPWALTWNPDRNTLFVGFRRELIEMTVGDTVEVVNRFRVRLPGEDVMIFGLAWNELDEETPLYIMDQPEDDDEQTMRLVRFNPSEDPGERTTREVAMLAQRPDEFGSGLTISHDWELNEISLATIGVDEFADVGDDFLRIFEIGPDSRMVDFNPGPYSVPADDQLPVEVTLDATGLLADVDYEIGLFLDHNAAAEPILVEVRLHVDFNDVGGEAGIPTEFDLKPAYPNPFNSSTRVQFSTEIQGQVTLTIYDLTGRRVTELVNGELPAGHHQAIFNAGKLPSGIYFYRLESGEKVAVRRMVLLR